MAGPIKLRRKGINSRAKGATGELEFAALHKECYGLTSRRTCQRCGKSGDASDVVCEELRVVHFEVKRTEKFQIYNAVDQAIRDSEGTGKIPVVVHRCNAKKGKDDGCRGQWLAVLPYHELHQLFEKAGLICPHPPSSA